MHMADALISPAVGGVMWAAAAAVLYRSAAVCRQKTDDSGPALAGVLAAFVFAVQMINFTIPGTGSSGHLGGGLLLAVLLGPHAASIAMASILTIQALFFADGGLLALGCNIVNLAVFPCFVAYPLVFCKLAGAGLSRLRLTVASVAAAVFALQLGAFAVVLETSLSGISSLPFQAFVLLMQPVHLAIGLVEGLVTAGVLSFIRETRPELVLSTEKPSAARRSLRPLLAVMSITVFVVAGVLSWFASSLPDGLEWAVAKLSGGGHGGAAGILHTLSARIQEQAALMPDYAFFPEAGLNERAGTSAAGLLGSVLTLAVVGTAALLLRKKKKDAVSP